MAGLTKKEMVAAIWKKFKGIIGTKDISGMGDGTVTGAITELNSNLIMSGINISARSGISLNTAHSYCRKYGPIIEFQIYLSTSISGSFTGYVADIPKEYAPKSEVWFPVFGSNGGTVVARGAINTDGSIGIINKYTNAPTIDYPQGRTVYFLSK